MMQKPKTSEAQRRAVANYQEKVDRVNCRFPKGTKQRIEATGSTINAFIIKAVEKELERIEAAEQTVQSAPQAANSREIPDTADVKQEVKEIDLQALYEEYGKDAILSVMGQINIMEKYGNEVLQDLVMYAKDQDAEQAPDPKQDFSDVPFMN